MPEHMTYRTIVADPPWSPSLGSTWATRFTDKARPAKAVGRKRHRVQDAVGMEAAQLVAGHTNPKMTAGYITVRDGLLARAAEAAQEAIG